MTSPSEQTFADTMRLPLAALGFGLVFVGVFMLLLIVVVIFQVWTAPEDVPIVNYMMTHVLAEERAIYGTMRDPASGQNIGFEVRLSQSVRSLAFLFIGVSVLGVSAMVLRVILGGGLKIIAFITGMGKKK